MAYHNTNGQKLARQINRVTPPVKVSRVGARCCTVQALSDYAHLTSTKPWPNVRELRPLFISTRKRKMLREAQVNDKVVKKKITAHTSLQSSTLAKAMGFSLEMCNIAAKPASSRGASTSAIIKWTDVSIKKVMQRAMWRDQKTFTRYYQRALATSIQTSNQWKDATDLSKATRQFVVLESPNGPQTMLNNLAKFLAMPMHRYLRSSKASAKSVAETYGILSEDLAAIVRHDYPLAGKLFDPWCATYAWI